VAPQELEEHEELEAQELEEHEELEEPPYTTGSLLIFFVIRVCVCVCVCVCVYMS
jgi:hypothetical protein